MRHPQQPRQTPPRPLPTGKPRWAVVISGGSDHYFGHFFDDEARARSLITKSKASEHGYSVSLYRRVDE